jgi:mono/diheme cytochrome c family protein
LERQIFMRMGTLALLAVLLSLATSHAAATDSASTVFERGRYLANAGNCVSCHTRERGEPFAGGVAFTTKFGTIYSTNITPDEASGLGRWTQQQFIDALRRGVRPNGEHLYPAFPYTSFTLISDADAAALFAYLKSLKPVRYVAPKNDLSFPYNQRWALGMWKALYFQERRFDPDRSKPADWNRGAYLTEGLGHCSACHTPRNFLGAEQASLHMAGGTYQDKLTGTLLDWSTPNLTSSRSALYAWSAEELSDYLRLGYSARASVTGPMNEVVMNSLRLLSEQDVRAIAVYLKSLPAKDPPVPTQPDPATLQAGALQYDIQCGTCHLPTGLGSAETAPPLAGSPIVLAADPASLINTTLRGPVLPVTSPSTQWQSRKWQRMEGFAAKLSDEDAAALLSYVRNTFGNHSTAVKPDQIARQR